MWEWHALGNIPISESHNAAPTTRTTPGTTSTSTRSARGPQRRRAAVLPQHVDAVRRGPAQRLRSAGASAARTRASSRARARHFYWQHDAEWQPGGLISVFDNGSTPPKEKQSRGLLLEPNVAAHTVTLRKQFTNPTRTLLASSQGNTLEPPGGDWLMGYGGLPNFTEYDSSGPRPARRRARQERPGLPHLPVAVERAVRTSSPSLAANRPASGSLPSCASWNGATEVASLARARRFIALGAGSGRRRRPRHGFRDRRSRSRAAGPYVPGPGA